MTHIIHRGVPVHDGGKFSWFKNTNNDPNHTHGSVELSTLCGPLRSQVKLYAQLWDSQTGQGFFLSSPRTGQTMLFTLYDCDLNDNEVAGWRFRGNVNGKTIRLLVIND